MLSKFKSKIKRGPVKLQLNLRMKSHMLVMTNRKNQTTSKRNFNKLKAIKRSLLKSTMNKFKSKKKRASNRILNQIKMMQRMHLMTRKTVSFPWMKTINHQILTKSKRMIQLLKLLKSLKLLNKRKPHQSPQKKSLILLQNKSWQHKRRLKSKKHRDKSKNS